MAVSPLKARIIHDFAFHPATDVTGPLHASIREICELAAHRIIDLGVPEGRELSLCITHLEEAMMWANAAVARHHRKD